MRYMPIIKVKAGMVLGQDIYDGEGKVSYGKGTMLNQEDAQELVRIGLPGIYMEDSVSDKLYVTPLISASLQREALRLVHDLFDESRCQEIEQDDIQEIARGITREIFIGKDRLYNMIDTRSLDDYAFFHSVNVAALAAMMGVESGNLDMEEINMLTTSALLHDVGRRYVEANVLNAKRTLTEEERILVEQHPKLSYDFLMEHYDFEPEVLKGVLEHHEWYNGCGYPMRRSGYDISYFARIIKVADVFDALTSKLPYHDPVTPSGAMDYLLANAGAEFDPDLVNILTKKIAIYPVGCEVALSDGRNAIVIENNRESMLRPKVRTLLEEEIIDLNGEDAKDLAVLELFV